MPVGNLKIPERNEMPRVGRHQHQILSTCDRCDLSINERSGFPRCFKSSALPCMPLRGRQIVGKNGKPVPDDTLHIEIQSASPFAVGKAGYTVDEFMPYGCRDGALARALLQPAEQAGIWCCQRWF